jgi:hypothetical protein
LRKSTSSTRSTGVRGDPPTTTTGSDDPTESTKDDVEIELGRPGFGPPNFFICSLNGRA